MKKGGESFKPQQVMLMLKSKSLGLAAYAVGKLKSGSYSLSINAAAVEKQIGKAVGVGAARHGVAACGRGYAGGGRGSRGHQELLRDHVQARSMYDFESGRCLDRSLWMGAGWRHSWRFRWCCVVS